MNKIRYLICSLFVGAFIFIFLGMINEELELGVFLIFPIFMGSGIFSFFGFLLLFSSIIISMYEFVYLSTKTTDAQYDTDHRKPKKTIKSGGILLIGPIPIVIGSNWKIPLLIGLIAIIILFLLLLFSNF